MYFSLKYYSCNAFFNLGRINHLNVLCVILIQKLFIYFPLAISQNRVFMADDTIKLSIL